MLTTLDRELPAAVRAAHLMSTPWSHAYLPETWPPGVALELARSFDRFELVRAERARHEKSYRFGTAELDGSDVDRLTAEWAAAVNALRGNEYRAAMSELTGVPLADSRLTLSVWEYGAGDWLAPHVDKPDKLVTQIFYLTEGWRDGHAGRLLILENAEPSSLAHPLPPRLGASAILVRSEKSWHAVESPAAGAARRRSLTATFWR